MRLPHVTVRLYWVDLDSSELSMWTAGREILEFRSGKLNLEHTEKIGIVESYDVYDNLKLVNSRLHKRFEYEKARIQLILNTY